MARLSALLLGLGLFVSCSSTRTASYHYTQKQIAGNDLDFAGRIRVDEYINAFTQETLPAPVAGDDLGLTVDSMLSAIPRGQSTALVQFAVKTRPATESERKESFGLCFVLDVSGSMGSDNKFVDAVAALKEGVAELPDGAEFALVTFASDSRVAVAPTVVDARTRAAILTQIDGLSIGGGTNIQDGLLDGYATLARFQSSVTRLLLLTDGQSNVGITAPMDLAKKARTRYLEGARISTIGLGHDVEEKTLRTIAAEGNGAYYFADTAKTLTTLLRQDLQSVLRPVAKSTRLKLTVSPGYKFRNVYGYVATDLLGHEIEINFGELNVDDWRIVVAEIEREAGAPKSVVLGATVDYVRAASEERRRHARELKLRWDAKPGQPERLNARVAKNAVIFADALALIQVSTLAKESRYLEASNVLAVQLANVRIAQQWDTGGELSREEATLSKTKAIVDGKAANVPVPVVSAAGGAGSSPTGRILRSVLGIAGKTAPGPWSVILSIFGSVFLR